MCALTVVFTLLAKRPMPLTLFVEEFHSLMPHMEVRVQFRVDAGAESKAGVVPASCGRVPVFPAFFTELP